MFLCYNKTETEDKTIEEGVSYTIHQSTIAKGVVHTRLAMNEVTREIEKDSKYIWSKYSPLNARVKTLTITKRQSAKLVSTTEDKLFLEIQKCPSNLDKNRFDEFCQNLFDSFVI